jgi:hypothetical protein
VPDLLTADHFRPALGQPFTIDAGEAGKLDLKLAGVRALADETAPDPERRAPFALDFRGPAEPVLAQATYRLQNDGLGPIDIFIVPVARDQGGTDYEAIFT